MVENLKLNKDRQYLSTDEEVQAAINMYLAGDLQNGFLLFDRNTYTIGSDNYGLDMSELTLEMLREEPLSFYCDLKSFDKIKEYISKKKVD